MKYYNHEKIDYPEERAKEKEEITDGLMVLVSIPLPEVVKMLSPDRFLRIHRGFSINLLHIDMLVGNTLIMVGGKKLPIGREHRKSVIGRFALVGMKSRKYMP